MSPISSLDVPPPLNAPPGRIAYKTGTSYGYRDAWAVGFDRKHTIGVWVGRPDNGAVPGLVGRVVATGLPSPLAGEGGAQRRMRGTRNEV
jgi:membrane carboxypeptidase/penicillin-binding protein PbpC